MKHHLKEEECSTERMKRRGRKLRAKRRENEQGEEEEFSNWVLTSRSVSAAEGCLMIKDGAKRRARARVCVCVWCQC